MAEQVKNGSAQVENILERKYHRAWYSAEQYKINHSRYYIYRNADGYEVSCTQIDEPDAPPPIFKDAIDKGLVVAWVRSVNIPKCPYTKRK